MLKRTLLAAVALSLFASSAIAQLTLRFRGTIISLDGTTLHLKTTEGPEMSIPLEPNTTVTALLPAKLAEIQPGSYIGIAAETQPDGTLVAKEVHIFPESMRGAGEGFRPFDLGPKSTMTNGTVGQEVKGTNGNTLTVAYKGGEKAIVVPPNAPIVTFAPGDKAMLTAGQHVIVQAESDSDGALHTDRVTVGKDGLVPPM